MKQRTLIMTLMASVLLVCFQNCGGGFSTGTVLQSKGEAGGDDEFFAYPYTSAPKFYSSIELYKKASSVENLSEFKVMASAAYTADPTAVLSYTVRVTDDAGVSLCPMHSGTLLAGLSTIEFDCVSSAQAESAKVSLEVSAGSESEVIEKQY